MTGQHRWSIIGLIILLSASLPATAQAQSYVDPVWTYLQNQYETASELNYSSLNYVIGKVNDGETDSWNFYLYAGTNYLFSAVCDNDCSDIDLVLANERGEEILSDTETDDTPVIMFNPGTSGTYTITIEMYECSVNPCYYGIGLFYQ